MPGAPGGTIIGTGRSALASVTKLARVSKALACGLLPPPLAPPAPAPALVLPLGPPRISTAEGGTENAAAADADAAVAVANDEVGVGPPVPPPGCQDCMGGRVGWEGKGTPPLLLCGCICWWDGLRGLEPLAPPSPCPPG